MRAFVPILILASVLAGIVYMSDDKPQPVTERYGDVVKRRCSTEATAERQKACYDQAILKKALEMANERFKN